MWQTDKPFEIIADGRKLEALAFGPPPDVADTIVMLHEGLGSVALWKDFPEAVAAKTGLGVLVYSRSGYGGSDRCELPRSVDYMHHEALSVLPVVLDEVGFQRGILLGHSDGASIAAIYGGGVQDHRVRGLILVAPHFFVETCTYDAALKARLAFEQGDLKKRLATYHRDVEAAFFGWNDVWSKPEFQSWDISDYLAYLRVPVLGIQGLADPYGTRAQVDILCDEVYAPVDLRLMKDVGHAPHVELRDEVLAQVDEFVLRLSRIETEMVSLMQGD